MVKSNKLGLKKNTLTLMAALQNKKQVVDMKLKLMTGHA